MAGRNVAAAEAEWVRAHEALSRLARERARADAVEGRCLLAAWRLQAHLHLGFGSFGEYVERLLGYKPRSTQEKLRVAEALEDLPAIAEALEQGLLNWSCARELSRVATIQTEREWLKTARGKTVHQLETLVAGKAPGDVPSSPSRVEMRRQVLRFEVAPETLAYFREAMNRLRQRSGARLDDDAALLLMARQVLGGPSDAGRASYQVALSVCPECGAGSQRACGELVPVGADVVAMARCDGQQLCLAAPIGNDSPPSTGNTPAQPDGCNQAQRVHNGVDTRAGHARARVGAHVRARAKQTIPPATRRAVLMRDHHCCTVPGCRNALFLDLHHLELRSEGGGNQADNLITLCGAHHRAAHRGELRVTGSMGVGLRFQHADGSDYGQLIEPRRAGAEAQCFAALRHLGFREGDVRRALTEVARNSDGLELEPGFEGILRSALAKLTASIGAVEPKRRLD